MKFVKKGLILTLTGLSLFTLAACKEDKRNQVVPYGSLSDKVVASTNGFSISEKELYNRLKYSYGYTVFTNKLNDVIYADEYKEFKYEGDDKISVDESVANAIYNSTDPTTLKKMSSEDKEKDVKKYIDSMSLEGFTLTADELAFDEITDETEHVSFSKLPEDLIKYYAASLVKEDANIKYLKSIADSEFLPDEDNPDIENENDYYISEDDLEDEYNDTYRNYYTAHGIILRFNSLEAAKKLISKVTNFSGSEDNYISLYNAYYSYKTDLTTDSIDESEDTTFVKNEDEDTLYTYSSDVSTFFVENLKDNEGLTTPRNIGGSYYLIYRKDLEYTYGDGEQLDYDDLDENTKQEINENLRNNIIEDKASSVSDKVFTDRFLDLDLKIYDPFIENSFANSYTDYEFVLTSNNDLIFETKNDKYTVSDFYEDLTNYNVNETLITLLLNKYMYATYPTYLDDDDEANIKDEIKNNLKSFNKGETSLNKAYGESNYLFFNYGYYTEDEVILNKLADTIETAYLADYIYPAWANDDHTPNITNLNILQNILETALKINENAESDFIDLNVDHILISVDNDGDGSPDDMDDFIASLSNEEKGKFAEAVNNLAKAILSEAEAISDGTNVDKLNYIVTAFNRNFPTCESDSNGQKKTWDDYKTYNFILTAESLGDVDTDSVSNYVLPFEEYLEDLYAKAVAEDLDIPEDDNNGIFYSPNGKVTSSNFKGISLTDNSSNLDEPEETTTPDLCQTNYGFHLISLNDYEKEDTDTFNFKFEEDSDTDGDYKEIRLVLEENDPDTDDDDIYIITNSYNKNEDKPSDNQLLIYYVQYTQGDVTAFRSAIENDLSDLLDDVIAKYQTSNFQKYLLIQSLDIKVEGTVGNFSRDAYLSYLKNQIEDYEPDTNYANWFDGSLSWSRHLN